MAVFDVFRSKSRIFVGDYCFRFKKNTSPSSREFRAGYETSFIGFSASAAIAGLVGGRLADSYPSKTKVIVIAAVLAMILGNMMYLVGGSVIYVIMGRVMCGKILSRIFFCLIN